MRTAVLVCQRRGTHRPQSWHSQQRTPTSRRRRRRPRSSSRQGSPSQQAMCA